MKSNADSLPRFNLKRRQQEVKQRLAALGLAGGPHRVVRGSRTENFDENRMRRLRVALEGLGQVFCLFGVYMSTRIDLLSATSCAELAALRDVPEIAPVRAARAVVRQETGHEPGELFLAFEEKPFKRHWLFQWHRARLNSGQSVTVKLISPEVEEYLLCDPALLLHLEVAFKEPGCSDLGFARAVDDFTGTLKQQLDFAEQATAFETLAQDMEECGLLRVPMVERSLCTPRMLTVEHLPGASLDEILSSSFIDEAKDAYNMCAGIDRGQLARRLCVVWLRQALLGNLFPVESWAKHIKILPNKQIAFTDGIFARLPAERRVNLWSYLISAANDHPDNACTSLLREMTQRIEPEDEAELRRRFRQVVPFRDSGLNNRYSESNNLFEHLFVHWRLAGERGCIPQPHLLNFYRGLYTTARIAEQLAPERDSLTLALQDIRVIAGIEKFRETVGPQHWGEQMDKYASVMLELPQMLDAVLTLAAEGNARVKLQGPETTERHRRKNSTAIMVSLLLLLAGFVLLSHYFRALFPGAWIDSINAIGFVMIGAMLLRAAHRA